MNKDKSYSGKRQYLIDGISCLIFELVMGGLQTRTREQYADDILTLVERDLSDGEWVSVDDMPGERDRWYLFGGYDSQGSWVFDKYHYKSDGTVNGWSIEVLKRRGNTHWMLPSAPCRSGERT